MKLNKIASLIKKNKRIILYNAADGTQWISNGAAMYSLKGMPPLAPENVLRFFGVPANKIGEWQCEMTELPEGIDFSDMSTDDESVEPMIAWIEWMGETYCFFAHEEKVYSVNVDYIKPIIGKDEYITYFKRETDSGGFMLAVMDGLELIALIMPYILDRDEIFINELKRLHYLFANTAVQRTKDALIASLENDKQMELNAEGADHENN